MSTSGQLTSWIICVPTLSAAPFFEQPRRVASIGLPAVRRSGSDHVSTDALGWSTLTSGQLTSWTTCVPTLPTAHYFTRPRQAVSTRSLAVPLPGLGSAQFRAASQWSTSTSGPSTPGITSALSRFLGLSSGPQRQRASNRRRVRRRSLFTCRHKILNELDHAGTGDGESRGYLPRAI